MKIHTRRKRQLGIPSHTNAYRQLHKPKRERPKKFTTQEAAKRWAVSHDIKSYELVPSVKGKWKVVGHGKN
ncbi:MAG TPA: hypothetical protein VJH97_01605 [Candidatus Nanoarchaeia archaeon]|nr:hypothetical protein [Candidatus Nanoarchaeia archaeon]